MEKRNTFSSGLGFVLAAAGSAVGLGNIWRFPYLAAKYGGGMFLLVYIILVFTFGYALMVAENAIGRKSGKSSLDAFASLNKKWGWLGIIATIIPAIILPYYNVIGGWILKYFAEYFMGLFSGNFGAEVAAGGEYFGAMLASPWTLVIAQTIFTLFIIVVLLMGVQKGVERVSTVLMPILIVIAIIISIYSITLPGAIEGVKYFFIPKVENFSVLGVLAAMGQMFYSLSLAMGIMIAYGSYMPKNTSLEKNVGRIEFFDTLIAVLAGVMIIPAVFAFDSSQLSAGPGLMFVTLPKVFASMPMSNIIGILFFFLVFAAAITSAMSLMETIVACVCDHTGLSRRKSVLVVGICCLLISLLPALGYNVLSGVRFFGRFDILDFMDFTTNSVLMPICALLICFFVTFGIGTKAVEEEVLLEGKFGRKGLFNVMIKYIAPILVCAVLVSSVLSAFGIITM
ncbi:MAG: sodium-dependent transporter [Clostridia bacterium]|nr:sodium-dependent transporter [Clostridia bacterium]